MTLNDPHSPVVHLTNAKKTYKHGGANVIGFDDVSLTVHRGQYLAIIGASGSGKSTLLNVLGTLDRLDAGTYRLDGQAIDELNDEELSVLRSRKIGFVFQSFHLLPRYTALENVELPMLYARVPRRQRRERAEIALDRVGLSSRAHHLPAQLSGGQQQRVSLARALVNEPSLILADEPTGALDSVTTSEILELFDELNRAGATIVMVTHDSDVAHRTRRIVRMLDGQVVEDICLDAGLSPIRAA